MNRFNSALISYILPAVAVCAVVYGSDYVNSTTMQVCKHEYALCTSAPCLPHPGDPAKAVCACNVEQGTSMSSAPCNTLQPSTDANGVRTIYSTFSFKQFQDGKKAMKCPSGTPWTWCLNKQCTVDPTNPKRAICICDVMRKSEWTTLGGNCNTSTCKDEYWSGATIKDLNDANTFMMKVLALRESPVKWCPEVSP